MSGAIIDAPDYWRGKHDGWIEGSAAGIEIAKDVLARSVRPMYILPPATQEVLDVLEAIVSASDGCIGHSRCNHGLEPWQRARAILQRYEESK